MLCRHLHIVARSQENTIKLHKKTQKKHKKYTFTCFRPSAVIYGSYGRSALS